MSDRHTPNGFEKCSVIPGVSVHPPVAERHPDVGSVPATRRDAAAVVQSTECQTD